MKFLEQLRGEGALRFRREATRFLTRQIGQSGELVFDIVRRDPIPKAVLEGEDIDFLLLDREDFGMRQLDRDLLRVHLDTEFFAQIEAGFDRKGAVQLDPFGAARPGVQHLVLNLDPALDHRELRDRRGLLQINAIVNRDPRLEVSQIYELVAGVAPDLLEGGHPLPGENGGKSLAPVEKERDQEREDEDDEKSGERTSDPT